MSFLDKIDEGVDKLKEWENKINKYTQYGYAAQEAKIQLDKYYNDISNLVDDNPDTDIITTLRSMQSGAVRKYTDPFLDGYDSITNSIDAVKKATQGIPYINEVINGMDKYTPDTAKDVLSNTLNNIFGSSNSMNNSGKVSSAWDSDFDRKINTYDPISLDIDINELVIRLTESLGYISNKFRSIQFAREKFFIEKPLLQSDLGGSYRSYVVFTRPDMNLVEYSGNKLVPVNDLILFPELLALVSTDLPLYSELCLQGCNKNNIFYLLSNYAAEVSPIRLSESERESTKNMHGVSVPVPGSPEYNNVELTVTFNDNARGDVRKIFNMIYEYSYAVHRQNYPKRAEYIKYNAFDYPMSIYIITVDADWEIIGFGVAINCVPTDAPTDMTQHNENGFGKNDLLPKFSINFKCKSYKPYRPMYFDYFNKITEFDPLNMIDTKGEIFTLETGSSAIASSSRGSVFDADGLFTTDFNKVPTYDKTSWSKSYSDRYLYTSGGNSQIVPDTAISVNPDPVKRVGTSVVRGLFKNPGTFEMLAKRPGVYRCLHPSEPNRPIFKLGFSY